ncbi:MAG TPA: helix-turn-helix domain-containing protein [Candidatus Acidoferrum sp.]|nr:helix-turn-helix domain-containing protein [Candidatus Acidoferrum sp.]
MLQHVTVIGFRKVLGTSLTIPMEMLNAADLIKRIQGDNYRKLQLQLVHPAGGNIPLTAGLELVCHHTLDDVKHTDLIILPALWGNPKGVARHYPQLLAWLRQHADTPICAVGTGSYFLAEAGLLDHKVATTHWYYFDQFAATYPKVILQRERFITRAGNLYCAGSVNSVRDVMLHFIEQHYDQDIANEVSRHFTHELKRSYTSSFLNQMPQHYHQDETVIEIQDWLHNAYHEPLTLQTIAGKYRMSVRTLNRRFKTATGKSPLQYLLQVRLDNAKELLKSSNLPIAEIADHCGYGDGNQFAAQFRKSMSVSPSAYRELVRKKLFQVNSKE